MQKLLLFTFVFFFFPILVLPDIDPVLKLILAYIIFEAKVALGFFLTCILAVMWSIIAFFKLLFCGFRTKHFVEIGIFLGISYGAFSIAKYKVQNLHRRPLKLLRGELSLIPDLKRTLDDLVQMWRSTTFIIRTVKSLLSDKAAQRVLVS